MKKINQLLTVALILSLVFVLSCGDAFNFPRDLNIIEEKLIQPQQAAEWSKLYEERYQAINSTIGYDDNRSSWYSVRELQAYIAYAQVKAREKGYNLEGFRLHLAVNPNQGGDNGYTTIFIAPTGSEIDPQRGSMLNFVQGNNNRSEDIDEIEVLDKGSGGDPPHDLYDVD
ncbi:hypothetical protein ACFQ1M_05805 [Sungkyunkwania multivorans]|uniref:Uncharacterized protein n=1 Tax=Sungkyunkwania multivorans TaxID=1173618 RepID=A0ABW3CXA2_9FLAO